MSQAAPAAMCVSPSGDSRGWLRRSRQRASVLAQCEHRIDCRGAEGSDAQAGLNGMPRISTL